MFGFECVILFIHITKQSPVKFFNAPKRRKSVVKILNLIKHPMSCFEYITLFILITKQSQTPVKFFSAPKRRKNVVKILKLKKKIEINKISHVLF